MILLPVLLFTLAGAGPVRTDANPRELGAVHWRRDLEAARAEGVRTGRPLLVLFQEVPGCQTCVNFGRGPMSHPLIVEAIETGFIPVVIFNNRPGADRQVLEACREPAFNNPVMRFFDARGRDLIPRKGGVYGSGGVAARLAAALQAAGREVPGYLANLVAETSPARPGHVTIAMHCFWEGEAALGGLDGVLATRAGFMDGREAVEVTFDAATTSVATLAREAARRGLADRVYVADAADLAAARRVVGGRAAIAESALRVAPDSDQKHGLRFSPLRALDLTAMQAARVNAALAAGVSPERWLSPRQRETARSLEKPAAR